MPDLKDHDAVQRFFLQEVQLGEEMLANGELEQGVEHLANAVAVCGQPHQLLQVILPIFLLNSYFRVSYPTRVLTVYICYDGAKQTPDSCNDCFYYDS